MQGVKEVAMQVAFVMGYDPPVLSRAISLMTDLQIELIRLKKIADSSESSATERDEAKAALRLFLDDSHMIRRVFQSLVGAGFKKEEKC